MEVENKPLVSIIGISYNHEKYICDCLNSIKQQTYSNIEIIVADDCSSDSTFELLRNWMLNNGDCFRNVIYYSNDKNLGVCKNINTAIKKAKGQYIKIIATDDILLENGIELLVESLLSDEKATMVCSNAVLIDEHFHLGMKMPSARYDCAFKIENLKDNKQWMEELFRDNFICAPSVMLKADTFERYGYYDESFSIEDWELWLRILSQGGKITYTEKDTVAYRVLSESMSHFGYGEKEEERYAKYIYDIKDILDKYKKYVNNGLDSFFYQVLSFAISHNYDRLIKSFYNTQKKEMSYRVRFEWWLNRAHLKEFKDRLAVRLDSIKAISKYK